MENANDGWKLAPAVTPGVETSLSATPTPEKPASMTGEDPAVIEEYLGESRDDMTFELAGNGASRDDSNVFSYQEMTDEEIEEAYNALFGNPA